LLPPPLVKLNPARDAKKHTGTVVKARAAAVAKWGQELVVEEAREEVEESPPGLITMLTPSRRIR
jgi:hypothetical protein